MICTARTTPVYRQAPGFAPGPRSAVPVAHGGQVRVASAGDTTVFTTTWPRLILRVIDHISLRCSNFEKSKKFYQAALAPLGYAVLEVVIHRA